MPSHPVDLMSFYPTLLDFAGLDRPPHLEGVSVRRYLTDPAATWDAVPAVTTWHFNNHTVRTDRWRYLRWNNGNEELYDHSNDPHEWHNLLAPENAERAAHLDLEQLVNELRAHFPRENRTTEEGARLYAAPATRSPREDQASEREPRHSLSGPRRIDETSR
jgi:arylsulfatase A-like enzyme